MKLLLFCTFVFIISCNGCQNKTQKEIQVKDHIDVKIKRFDRQLFAVNPARTEEDILKLYKEYGAFYQSYAHDVLNMPIDSTDTLYVKPMRQLLAYKPLIDLERTVDSMYNDLSDVEKELSFAMSVYQQEFKPEKLPSFITFISEFGYANITYENEICIGLDMYMNKRYADYYRAYEFPEFMIRKLQREYIAPNAIKALAINKYESQTTKDKRFLAMMIVEGKIRYFTKALLPQLHDTILMGYTQAQLNWSSENEPQMWTHFIEKKILYQNEPSQYIRYFNDGPFTSADGVPPESSPMIGTWAGLQIVRKYMQENPNVTLKELMEETNFEKILKLSKYRPK